MRLRFRPRRQEDRVLELPEGARAADVLRATGQPASATVVVRAGTPIPESAALRDGDELLLLSSFSGG